MKRWLVFLLVGLLALLPTSAWAQSPAPSVVLWTAYPTVVQDKGQSVTFDLELSNKTTTWQDIDLKVEGPADWEATFRKSGYIVRRVMVEPEKSLSFDLQLKPPENVSAGEYIFTVKATTQERVALKDLRLVVVMKEKTGKGGLKFTTDYPNVRGQPGTSFTFRFDLVNQAEQERTVNFEATTPKDWEVVFKPGYESRQISSLPLKGNASQTINVDITAPSRIEAGDYKFVVRAIAENDRVEVPLVITIVGKPSFSLNTATGQLNTRVSVDAPAKMTLVLRNTGSAPLQNVSFYSYGYRVGRSSLGKPRDSCDRRNPNDLGRGSHRCDRRGRAGACLCLCAFQSSLISRAAQCCRCSLRKNTFVLRSRRNTKNIRESLCRLPNPGGTSAGWGDGGTDYVRLVQETIHSCAARGRTCHLYRDRDARSGETLRRCGGRGSFEPAS